ncbi:MAG: hypothetical protein ACR2OG_17135 [Gemmatimonadaceae bacterium]
MSEDLKEGQLITRRALVFIVLGACLLSWAELTSPTPPQTAMVLLRLPVVLVLCWRVYQGNRYARAILIVMAASILAAAIAIGVTVRPVTPDAWRRMVSAAPFVIGTVLLLLSPKARLYFAARRAGSMGPTPGR